MDFKILEDARCYGHPTPEDLEQKLPDEGKNDNADIRYCAAPLGLFYVNKVGHLLPIAIQINQQHGPDNPIWTPNEPNKHDWMLAKFWLAAAEANFHQVRLAPQCNVLGEAACQHNNRFRTTFHLYVAL